MSKTFQPLTIRARLVTPLSIEEPIHLEGILYDARYRRDPSTKGTPLACLAYEFGIPKASAGILVESGATGVRSGVVSAVRSVKINSTDNERIHADAKTPSSMRQIGEMSPYRARLRDYRTLSGVREVIWQAVGDRDGIMDLLSQVPGIGTLRNRGFGQVADWEVEACEADAVGAGWFADGKVLRRLPSSVVRSYLDAIPEGVSLRLDRLQPPFWDDQEEIEVVAPMLKSMTMTIREARAITGLA